MEFVLDCSIAMSWFFEDEEIPAAHSVIDLLADGSACVPTIWTFEVANVLWVAENRGRLSRTRSLQIARQLSGLPIAVDSETTGLPSVWPLLSLCRKHALSAYDAAYLELALRKLMPLATADIRLAKAARQTGITLIN